MQNIQPPSMEEVKQAVSENNQALNWIKEWQRDNPYSPEFTDEYNAKFKEDFNKFIEGSDLSQETKDYNLIK